AMELRRARDWNDPRLLRQQPGKRDLSRRRLLPFSDSGQQIHESLIRFPVLRREARNNIAEIALVEFGLFADLACEEPLAQRTEGDESNPEFLKSGDHLRLRLSPPKRIFALQCGDRLDFVSATDGLNSCF